MCENPPISQDSMNHTVFYNNIDDIIAIISLVIQ